jgi:hypothetical protein
VFDINKLPLPVLNIWDDSKFKALVSTPWPFPTGDKPATPDFFAKDEHSSVRVCHAISETGKGGVTLAYRKCSEYRNSRMVEVATSYCSPHEVFNKKIGNAIARQNFSDGNTVLVPAGNCKFDSVPAVLKVMFWYSLQ